MTTRDELAALAKSGAELGQRTAGALAVARWGAGASEDARASLYAVTALTSWVFFGAKRDNRPEPIFWHNFRVGEDVNQSNAGNPLRHLKTFIAVAHDVCEDSRKLRPDNPVTPEGVARLWRGSEAEKQLIIDVLYLKTDAVGLEGDARRARQHERVVEVAAGKHSQAGKIYAEIMAADKTDNIRADLEDMQQNRISFASRAKGLEYLFKKAADAQIVSELPVTASVKEEFQSLYESVISHAIIHRLIPANGKFEESRDNRLAEKLTRAQAASKRQPPSEKDAYNFNNFTGRKTRKLASELTRLKGRKLKFTSRTKGLEYAFIRTAEALTVHASPVDPVAKSRHAKAYKDVMRELLYAGSITPTIIEIRTSLFPPLRTPHNGRIQITIPPPQQHNKG
ncbi:MAG: hypothetical protein KBA75_06690 [Alphaproteobacteria bacterium]|nr:hypothetical protein [Alphaproteobacteria bacterium]